MKYMVSGMKPVAVKKPFNFDAAYEALEQSFRKASDAYEALVTSGSAVEEFEACLRDGAAALESIKKYGVTPQNMSLINEGNQLDKALGLEALDMTAIESLSESTKKLLQDNYTKGLEALGSENLKSFVQAIKDFFKKILEWLKERFFGLSRLTKILENTKIEGELDGEKKITAIACDDIKAILDDQTEFSDSVHTIAEAGGKPAAGFMQDLDALDKKGSEAGTLPEKKEDTVSGDTEKNSPSTVTHTPCWHLPMQKVPPSSILSLRFSLAINSCSRSTTGREPLMWQDEPIHTVTFIVVSPLLFQFGRKWDGLSLMHAKKR